MVGGFRMPASLMAAFLSIATASHVTGQQISNTPRPEMWVTDGEVYVLAEDCGTLYIGGNFTHVGPNTGGGALINQLTGAVSIARPVINGTVWATASDGAGGWYIVGTFTSIGTVTRNRIAHILADGSVDANWNPDANSTVFALAVSGGTVYVGGDFTSIGGQLRNRIAALDSNGNAVPTWNPDANNVVYALAVYGGTVYAGGDFSFIGGQPRNRIAALDNNGTAIPAWDPDANNTVRTLAVSGGTVYAGGLFTHIGGLTRNRIAALNSSGNALAGWNPDADNTVFALSISGGTLYAGGDFNNIGGQTRMRIAALDASGNALLTWDAGGATNGTVFALTAAEGTVFAGGSFSNIGGQQRNRVAALDTNGNALPNWNPNANSTVYTLVISGGNIYAGGLFSSIGRQPRNRIAALDTNGNALPNWNPNASNVVRALAVSGETVYVGGTFNQSQFNGGIGGQPRNYIAALDKTTGLATNWNPNATTDVFSILISDGTVYAGGQFSGIGGQTRRGLAALDSKTGLATPWNPDCSYLLGTGLVRTLIAKDEIIYAGGLFNNIGGQLRKGIAALNRYTGFATEWNPNPSLNGNNADVYTMVATDGMVYAGGTFTSIGGQTRWGIAELDSITGLATDWNPVSNNTVRSMVVTGGTVYAGGLFTSIGGLQRNYVAAIDRDTGVATAWDPNANDRINSITLTGDTLYMGGNFTTLDGRPRRGVGAFSVITSEWTGGTGTWSDAPQWFPPIVPNNGSCELFHVNIAVPSSNVTLDIDPTINSLKLASNTTLSVSSGNLTLVTPEGIINNGSLSVSNNYAIFAGAPMTISGSQPVTLNGGALSSTMNDSNNIMTLDTPVIGYGGIDAAFINQSTIAADTLGQTLVINGSLPASSYATIHATGGGTLEISRPITGSGDYLADGGAIDISGLVPIDVNGANLTVYADGSATSNNQSHVNMSEHVLISFNPCFTLGCSPPILSIAGGSSWTVGGNFTCQGLVNVVVQNGTGVTLAGHFTNESTSNDTFEWESGPLTLNGTDPQDFEMAGQDLGDSDPDGFINNFAMGTFTVAAGRTINFVNNFDNSAGAGCEALYVDELVLGTGCTLNLNGCNIYYRRIDDQGANVTGGQLLSALIGDMTCDGSVNGSDVAAFVLALTDPAAFALAYPGCSINHADLNQSGGVDLSDVPGFVNYLLNGT